MTATLAGALGGAWALMVGWAFVVRYPESVGGYAAVAAWMQRGGDLCAAGAILLCAALGGRALLRRAGAEPAHPAAGWTWSAALGLGVLALMVFGLGLAGWMHPLAYLGLLALCAAAGRAETAGLRADVRRIAFQKRSVGHLAWVAIFALPLWLGYLMAVSPPTGYDALVYHLGLPSAYLAEGRISPIPWSVHAGFPQIGEMLYLLGWRLGGTGTAGLLHWAAYGLTGLGLYGMAAPRWGAMAGRWAAALWLWTPAAGLLAGAASVDLFVTLFILAAGGLLLDGHPGLAGMAAGLALGAKYTAALPVLVMGGALTAAHPRRVLPFAGAALVTMSPWLARNGVWYGNPVHPLLPHLFPAATAALRDAAIRYTTHVGGHGDMRGAWDWFRLPWLMVFDGVRFGGGFDQWGPWPLLAPVGLLLTRTRDNIAVCLAICVLVVLVGWGASARVLRLLVPILPFLAILAVQPLAQAVPAAASGPPSRWVRPALMLAMLSGLAIWGFALGFVDPGPVAAGAEAPASFLHRKLGDLVSISEAANRLIPAGGRVAWIGEPRHALVTAPRVAPTVFDDAPPVAAPAFTHAVIRSAAPGDLATDPRGRVIYRAGEYRLIELRPAGTP